MDNAYLILRGLEIKKKKQNKKQTNKQKNFTWRKHILKTSS